MPSVLEELQDVLNELSKNEFLNDMTIDVMITKFAGISSNNSIAYIPSLTIDNVLSKQQQGNIFFTKEKVIKSLGKLFKDRYENCEGILIPIHGPQVIKTPMNNHWSLAFFSKERNNFYHYDSLQTFNSQKFDAIVSLLKTWDIIPMSASLYNPKWIPKQPEFWECGFFVIIFASIIGTKRQTNPISKGDIKNCIDGNVFDMNPASRTRIMLKEFALSLIYSQNNF